MPYFKKESLTTQGQSLSGTEGKPMTSNFKVLVHRDSRSLHLKLLGDFEASSISILASVIRKFSFGVKNIFLHTGGLNNIGLFDPDELKRKLSIVTKGSAKIVFTGDLAVKIAPRGSVLVC
jgi:hypothetical protein